jgi:hypothetical protein
MKKQIMAVITGAVMSTAAFAAEPAANPMTLSDSQMDVVTAGTNSTPSQPRTNTITRVTQTQNNTNVGINPTVGLNVAVLTFGSGGQNVGANNPQRAGGVQVVH